jgi:copper chaperone CopZ
MTIKNELSEIKGIVSVEGDPQNKTLVVEYEEPASLQKIKDTLKEINYPSA